MLGGVFLPHLVVVQSCFPNILQDGDFGGRALLLGNQVGTTVDAGVYCEELEPFF